MKVNREQLLNVLESVSAGVSVRDIIEQSSCVVFKNDRATTYNGEIACSMRVKVGFESAVPLAPLKDLLEKMTEDTVDIDRSDKNVRVVGKRRRATLRTDGEITLPVDMVERPGKWRKLPDEFSDAMEVVHHCAANDDGQYPYSCVSVTPEWIEATDKKHVTRFQLKVPIKQSFLIRKEAAGFVGALAPDRMSETPNWTHYKAGNDGMVLSCRKYDLDEFRDLSAIFKGIKGSSMTLPKGLALAVETAEIFSEKSETSEGIVEVHLQPGKLRLSGKGIIGQYQEVRRSSYDGPEIKFLIEAKLLRAIVSKYDQAIVTPDRMKVLGTKFEYVVALESTEG